MAQWHAILPCWADWTSMWYSIIRGQWFKKGQSVPRSKRLTLSCWCCLFNWMWSKLLFQDYFIWNRIWCGSSLPRLVWPQLLVNAYCNDYFRVIDKFIADLQAPQFLEVGHKFMAAWQKASEAKQIDMLYSAINLQTAKRWAIMRDFTNLTNWHQIVLSCVQIWTKNKSMDIDIDIDMYI